MADAFALLTPNTELDSGVGPFNLTWFNAVTEAVRAKMRSDRTPSQETVEIQFDPWIWLANISGEPIPQYTAVGLGSLSILPGDNTDFKRRLSFSSADLADGEPFGIVQDPIEANSRFVAKASVSAGELQPPNPAKWVRLLGEPEAHDSGTRYVIGQQVTVSSVTYACVKPHYNVTPPDTDYWVVVGTDVGIWKVDDAYSAGDVANLPTVGRLIVDGATRAWVDVSDVAHRYAGIVGGELVSMADEGPLFFLWKAGGTGEQWAVVVMSHRASYEDCCAPQDIEVYEETEWTTPCTVTVLVELTATGGMPTDAGSIGEDFISGGGGGGAYSASVLTLDPGTYSITEDADFVYFSDATPTVLVKAEKGAAGTVRLSSSGTGTAAGGAGGDAANGIGDVRYSGGDGGQGEIFAAFLAGGGGGGAGGRYGDGLDGDDGQDGVTSSGQGGASGGSVYYRWDDVFSGETFVSTGADGLTTGTTGYEPNYTFGNGISSGNVDFETTAGSESRFQARITVVSSLADVPSVVRPSIDGGTW